MKKTAIYSIFAAYGILLVIFAFSDWQIAQALYNPESAWGYFSEAYGQLLGSFLGLMSGSILIRLYQPVKNAKSIAGLVGLYLATIFMAFGFSYDFFGGQIDEVEVNMGLVLALAAILMIGGQVIVRRFSPEALVQYKYAAQVSLAVVFVGAFVSVWLIKIPWGRWTYRDIVAAGDPTLFTRWFLPQGVNGHHSFFSGHTAFAFSALPFIYYLKPENKVRTWVAGFLVAWGVFVALGRMIAGAHFASDVLVGSGVILVWMWVFTNAFAARQPAPVTAPQPAA